MNPLAMISKGLGNLRWAFGALVLLCLSAQAQAEPIRPNDVLTVRIVEWQVVDAQMRDWSSFGGDYIVGGDGVVSFPFIGPLTAEGLSESELASAVSKALSNRFALFEPVEAIVTRPSQTMVIVGGAVRTPGEVRFRSDMTARHAISLAGGWSASQASAVQVRVDALTAQTQLSVLQGRENVLLARIARLMAERDGLTSVVLEESVAARLAPLVASENAALELSLSRKARELELVKGRIQMLQAEIAALAEKKLSLEKQRDMAAEEKLAIDALSERGLTVNARVLDANRTLVTVETQILDVMTASLRAQQNLASAKSDELQLIDGAAATVLQELQQAEAELVEVQARRVSQEVIIGLLSAEAGNDPALGLQVVVYRRADGETQILKDAMDLPLRPGDMVEVLLPPIAGRG